MQRSIWRRIFSSCTIAIGLLCTSACDFAQKSAMQPSPVISEQKSEAGKTIVLAIDGTGDFTSLQATVDSIPDGSTQPVDIHVMPGVYDAQVTISAKKPPIHLHGDDASTTILTHRLMTTSHGPNGKPVDMLDTASLFVDANDFEADNISFVNSSGKGSSQALALSVRGDRQIYRNCIMSGWQDTLYVAGGRSYFENCHIDGGADFIFGPGTAVFRGCEILSKAVRYVTAASTPKESPYGFVMMDCRLIAAPGVKNGSCYLGRPWGDYASVIYMHCEIGAHISKLGWANWKNTHRDKTARFSEYRCTGPGADTSARVPWSHQLTDAEAAAITISSVLGAADGWDPNPGALPTTRADAAAESSK